MNRFKSLIRSAFAPLGTMSNAKLRLTIGLASLALVVFAGLLHLNDTASALIFWGSSFTILAPDIRTLFQGPKMSFALPNMAEMKTQMTAMTEAAETKRRTNTQRRLDAKRARQNKQK